MRSKNFPHDHLMMPFHLKVTVSENNMSCLHSDTPVSDQNGNVNHSLRPLINARTRRQLDRIHTRKGYYIISDESFNLVWINISVYVISHLIYFYGLYQMLFVIKWNFHFCQFYLSGEWSSDSFKCQSHLKLTWLTQIEYPKTHYNWSNGSDKFIITRDRSRGP